MTVPPDDAALWAAPRPGAVPPVPPVLGYAGWPQPPGQPGWPPPPAARPSARRWLLWGLVALVLVVALAVAAVLQVRRVVDDLGTGTVAYFRVQERVDEYLGAVERSDTDRALQLSCPGTTAAGLARSSYHDPATAKIDVHGSTATVEVTLVTGDAVVHHARLRMEQRAGAWLVCDVREP